MCQPSDMLFFGPYTRILDKQTEIQAQVYEWEKKIRTWYEAGTIESPLTLIAVEKDWLTESRKKISLPSQKHCYV